MENAENNIKVVLAAASTNIYPSPDGGRTYQSVELFDRVRYIADTGYIVLRTTIFGM
jgi:hypothetical protein